jgi:NitT/TauT family transport system substrate-binding protein
MVHRWKALPSIVGAAVLALLLWWDCAAIAAANIKKVRVTYSGWGIATAVAYVGIDAQVFKQYDLDIEEVFIRDALSGGVQALVGVDFVLGFGNPAAILKPISEGADIVFVGSHVGMERYELGVAPDITAVGELKGKKVGVSGPGRKSDLIVRVILRRAGLDPIKDVQIVAAGFSPQRAAALSQGLIQAAPLSPDIALGARRQGLKVLEVKEVPIFTALLMTTRSFIKRDGEAVRRFMKGYLAAIHYYLTHRSESVAIMRKYVSGADPVALEAMYDTFAAQLRPLPGPDKEATQALIDAAAAADAHAATLKPKDLFDLRFLVELKGSGFIDKLYSEKTSL